MWCGAIDENHFFLAILELQKDFGKELSMFQWNDTVVQDGFLLKRYAQTFRG